MRRVVSLIFLCCVFGWTLTNALSKSSIGKSSNAQKNVHLRGTCVSPNTWTAMPAIPKPTGECAAGVIGNAMFLAGEANTETFKFDFGTGKWSTVANRIFAGNHHASAVIGNEWWLVGGIDNHAYGKVQVYNPSTNKWIEKASLPWDGGSVCLAYIDGVLWACGGIEGFGDGQHKGGTATTNKCAYYNVSSGDNSWHTMAPMPYGRNHAAVSTDGKKMWVFGGRMGKNVPSNGYNTTQVFDPRTRKWSTSHDGTFASLPIGRGGTGHAVHHDGKFYVFGGETANGPGATNNYVYSRVDVYDVGMNKWSQGKDMVTPRHGMFPVYYEGAIHVASGGLHHGYSVTQTYDKYCL